ncbi:potassium channel family protein [Aerococcaceae bacterium NML191292]|nr:potassium channel family protein [Aerococcaceae bacterium NML191292]MCW6661464.1 potassium channel family protein [Aerococcaceae bacterium NML201209]MCW6665234.1 potassium channel family protein [Aerococcaceae bacterium NML191219]MCW6675536.1 potassium channel family protein [Aerococcaceae bacterium NML171108]
MLKRLNYPGHEWLRTRIKSKYYRGMIVVLAIISITLVLLDYADIITLLRMPYRELDIAITVVFTFDYLIRLWLADYKWLFVRKNVFDLLAIMPMDAMFTFFRVGRILRVTRLTKVSRLSRLIGLSGKLKYQLQRFLNTNGLIYVIYINLLVILCGSTVFFLVEQKPFGESLWWAIVTTTTVGYGDTVPVSVIGKVIATILMFFGIGTIGMLTSTFTKFFIQEDDHTERTLIELRQEIAEQKELINQLIERLDQK